MEYISERTWVVVGAVVGVGMCAMVVALALPVRAEGTLYVSFSDASRTVHNVSEISVEITGVELHSPRSGWVDVAPGSRTYDLFALKRSGARVLAGQVRIPAGLYDQVRVSVGSVEVKTSDGAVHDAALGSHTFMVAANTVVGSGRASHINVDINAASSLHVTADGVYVFVPVVVFHSAENIVAHVDGGAIVASGGTVNSNIVLGSDLAGRTYKNLSLAPNIPLTVANATPHMAFAGGQAATPGSVADTSLVQIGQDGVPQGE